MSIEYFSNFVLDFIQKHKDSDDIEKNWNSESNKKVLQKILKSTHNKKDPNKPKRGRSSYILFCDDYRHIVKTKFPELTNKELTSKLAELWRELKQNNVPKFNEYEEKSLKEREIYKQQMQIYDSTLEKPKKSKKPKEDKPKEEKIKEDKPKEKKIKEDKPKEKKIKEEKPKEKEEKVIDKRFENYYNKKVSKTKKAHPDLSKEEIDMKILKKWKKLSDEEKNEY